MCVLLSSPPVHPPQITQHPASQLEVDPGIQVVFSVIATEVTELKYQWQLNDRDLLYPLPEGVSGTTTATLTISRVAKTNKGKYRCIVSNTAGHATSDSAQLTVCESVLI